VDRESEDRANREAPLVHHVADLEEDAVLAIVRQRLEAGDDPLVLIYECDAGMRIVGRRYEEGEYYIAALIMAGEIFREVVELVKPHLTVETAEETVGQIVVGTVQGDIHDIGKDVLSMLLVCHGFSVRDLGVDVAPATFVQATLERKPDIVALSGLLTSAYDSMRETVAQVREATADWPSPPPIIIGGGRIDEEVCRYVGADRWTDDAMKGVHLCERIIEERQPPTD
jgi:methanogenic corrinoid protein MtbC1